MKTQPILEQVVFFYIAARKEFPGKNQDLNLHNVIDHIPNKNQYFLRFFPFASSSG